MKRLAPAILLVVHLAIVMVVWARHSTDAPMGSLFAGGFAELSLAFGRLAGMLAVSLLFVQLLVIGRVRWIEPAFGMDRLTRFHHVNAAAIIALLALHAGLINASFSIQNQVGRWAQLVDFLKTWDDVAEAAIAVLILIAVGVLSVRALRKRMPYELWYFLHLPAYLAILLAFGHQLEVGDDFAGHPAFAAYWYAAYAFVLGNVAAYRVAMPLIRTRRHRFVVEKLVPETADVTSVHIGGRMMEQLRFEEGQFVIVRFLAKDFWWEAHPFSLSRAPDGGPLRVSIKGVGDFTRRVPKMKEGTKVCIDGPHGVFTAARCRGGKALLIAGGIGITPLRAMAEALVPAGKDVVLLFGNRAQKDIVFRAELEAIAKGGKFAIHHVLSQDPAWPGERGHIDQERVARLVPDFREREIYVCGPPPMMRGIVRTLRKAGVPRKRIHFELFAL